MNIKGLFDYDRVLMAKDNLEAELLMAKLTATELTKENDELHRQNLEQQQEIFELKHKLEKLEQENTVKWHYSVINVKNGIIPCWVPSNGTARQIMSKYPVVLPVPMSAKQVPEA